VLSVVCPPHRGRYGRTPGVPRNTGCKAKARLLRGSLALDALHLLPRDVDRSGELVGLEYPAFHHILNRRRSEAQILGRFPYGDFHAVFVFHSVNLPTRQRLGRDTPKDNPDPTRREVVLT
jgi:hypothetical protein